MNQFVQRIANYIANVSRQHYFPPFEVTMLVPYEYRKACRSKTDFTLTRMLSFRFLFFRLYCDACIYIYRYRRWLSRDWQNHGPFSGLRSGLTPQCRNSSNRAKNKWTAPLMKLVKRFPNKPQNRYPRKLLQVHPNRLFEEFLDFYRHLERNYGKTRDLGIDSSDAIFCVGGTKKATECLDEPRCIETIARLLKSVLKVLNERAF